MSILMKLVGIARSAASAELPAITRQTSAAASFPMMVEAGEQQAAEVFGALTNLYSLVPFVGAAAAVGAGSLIGETSPDGSHLEISEAMKTCVF